VKLPEEGAGVNTTKHDLVVDVAKQTGLTQSDAKIVAEELIEALSRMLEEGQTIEIRGFGTFYTKVRKPRPARNPKTGQVIPLAKRSVPLFKYSSALKKRISEENKARVASA
jgi:integration host factor subunit beta